MFYEGLLTVTRLTKSSSCNFISVLIQLLTYLLTYLFEHGRRKRLLLSPHFVTSLSTRRESRPSCAYPVDDPCQPGELPVLLRYVTHREHLCNDPTLVSLQLGNQLAWHGVAWLHAALCYILSRTSVHRHFPTVFLDHCIPRREIATDN